MHPFGNLSHPGSEERESASTPGLFLAGRTRNAPVRCHLSYIMTPVFLLDDTGFTGFTGFTGEVKSISRWYA